MLPTTTTCAKTLQAAQAQEKQAAAEFVHLQKQQMYETVNEAILHYSTSTGKPQDVARQELFTIERLNRRKRILSPRDIFIREKMQEINKDKPKGERVNLVTVRQKFNAEYEALSQEEIAELKHQAEEEQQNKRNKVPKQLKRAQQHDVTKTAKSFQEALDALHCRTGHYGVCILVRGDRSINSRPVFLSTGNLGDFFEDYTSKPLQGILEELDAWCTNGLKGRAQGKKNVQECKKYIRNQLKMDLRRASGDSNAEVAWKYYQTQVSLRYGLFLEGYPRKEICDPSNLTMSELFELRKSLQDGKCSFKRLPDADKKALQETVDEQERNGQNPWGKRKRRSDAGKPKKKRRISESTAHLSSTYPPSCSSSDHETHGEMDVGRTDSGDESASDGGISPEFGRPQTVVPKRSLKIVNPVAPMHRSSGKSTSASAFSSALVARPSIVPAFIAPVVGVREMARGDYRGRHSEQLPKVFPTYESLIHYYDSESEEEEFVEQCVYDEDDDPIAHLARLTKSLGG